MYDDCIYHLGVMSNSFLAVLLLAFVVAYGEHETLSDQQESGIEENLNRPEGDLAQMPVALDKPGSRSSDCQLLCSNRDTCVAWAYNKCHKDKCFLKIEETDTVRSGCFVSLLPL